ncbi:hypothetical protein LY474_02950 [Myxococcus stipitatus]|uniref:hypothetical protein n=1 Tax=Myxococcus stipitatus TaxID=83455 RepID=UPI001F20AB27|nr:hypothetical protein [Myxococcus stipitatus]MCE9666761.1 hypothetical protein [Myxococcus stipitatus]
MSTPRRFHLLVPALLVSAMAGCLPFDQDGGDYVFTPVEVFRDECGLYEANKDAFTGTLQVTGRVVRLDFGLLDLQLIGYFLAEGDDFSLDGTIINAAADVRGESCLLDEVSIHMDATTQCQTHFDGVLRVRYATELRPAECGCELWMRYEAVKGGQRCD